MSSSELISDGRAGQARLRLSAISDWRWFWLSLLVSTVPMLIHYFIWNWQYEQYHFFPILIIAVAALAYSRFDGIFRGPRNWLVWSAIGLGGLATLVSLLVDSPWLSTVAFVLFVTAFFSSSEGSADATLVGLAVPLVLLVRLPLGYDQLLVIWLQKITTELSSVLLDVIRIPHAATGNVIQLASRELFVAEACSGIQSVFTLAFVALILVAVNRRPIFMSILYFIVACILAVAANVLRVSSVAAGEAWFDIDLASGWPHEAVGYIALAVGIGLLLSFDQLFAAIVHPVPECGSTDRFNPLANAWNWFAFGAEHQTEGPSSGSEDGRNSMMEFAKISGLIRAFVITGGVLFLGSAAVALTRDFPVIHTIDLYAARDVVFDPSKDLFDSRFNTLRAIDHQEVRDGADPRLGENADVWTCQLTDRRAQLVLSQTYNEWHEFCVCYEIGGWRLLNREVDTATVENPDSSVTGSLEPTVPESEIPFAVALFNRDDGKWGQLFYAGITVKGNYVDPPELTGGLSGRFMRTNNATDFDGGVLMCQIWVTGDEKLDREVYGGIKADFARALAVIAIGVKEQTSAEVVTTDQVQ